MDDPQKFFLNPSSKDRAELTKQQAIDRTYQATNLVYLLEITFQKFVSSYTIRTQINFDYDSNANKSNHLKLEYSGKYLLSLRLNETTFSQTQLQTIWHDNFLNIPIENLINGRNILFIVNKNEFSTDGTALFSYTEGSHQYIYSLMAPNHCHKIFPCFDQPNIKALFYVQIIAPAKWLCISNEAPIHIFDVSEELCRWVFEPKAKVSTYLLAIMAGDYKSLTCPIESSFERIPLKLYFKQNSLFECEQSQKEIFELTNFGMKFYTEYFQIPYPFSKYDHIFCPEFNFLGMENPGAVSLTDSYLFWDIVTSCKRTARCLTILHELAHMWFGNLVTMKWWDDLWLNESFAVYISHYCLQKMSDISPKLSLLYSDSMVRFFFYKRDGYEEDSIAETTHAICQMVQTTEKTSEIFNSITYSKGAAVIKQMMYMISETVFSKILKQYFEKFRWSNADLNDFIEIIEGNMIEKKGFSIKHWKSEWLQWASLNVMTIKDLIKEQGIIKILQEPISLIFPYVRTHFFKLCVYYHKKDSLDNIYEQIIDIQIKETELIVPIVFEDDVSDYGILLNYEDHGYFKTNFDENSLVFFKKNFLLIKNILSRALILLNFYDMIFETNALSVFDFLDIIKTMLSIEDDIQIFNQSLNYASRVIENYLPEALKSKGATDIFNILYDFLRDKTTSSEKILVIKEFLGRLAKHPDDITKLVNWLLQKNLEIKHIAVNSYMLTHTIELIFTRRLLTENQRKDLKKKFVENNKYYKLFCEYSMFNLEQKAIGFDKFLDPSSSQDSVYLMSFAMKGFNNEWDKEASEVFEKRFFETVELVFEKCNNQYAKTFFKRLFPRTENLRKQIGCVEELLKKKGDAVLECLLKEKLQSLRQKLKVYNKELKLNGMEEM